MKYYVIGSYNEFDNEEICEFDNEEEALKQVEEFKHINMVIKGEELELKKVTTVTKWAFK